MRNNTKLKYLLLKYELTFSMNDTDDVFQLTVMDRVSKNQQMFTGDSYGSILNEAYKFMKQDLKMSFKE